MRKFGLEVEYGGSIQMALNELYADGLTASTIQTSYSQYSQTHWVVKSDASVSSGGELVSPPLDFDDPEQRSQVDRAIAALKRSGAKVEQSAGIHVHVDASDLDGAQVAAVARCFTKFEDVLYRIASSGWHSMRPDSHRYCPPLKDSQVAGLAKARNKSQVERAYYGGVGVAAMAGHGHGSRYCGINLHSWFYRGTIEFRIFNSSMNAERIQAYIAICVAMVQDARNGKKRSVNQSFRLGGMHNGTTKEKAAYHRFQQVMRYEAGMSIEDYKRMNRCWKDSVPQPRFSTGYGW